ncbi:hypothetical protein AGLY_011404, partial [Aphis glycines]
SRQNGSSAALKHKQGTLIRSNLSWSDAFLYFTLKAYFSTRLQRHFAKYEQRRRFKYGFSIFCVVAIKFHGTEINIAAEKYLVYGAGGTINDPAVTPAIYGVGNEQNLAMLFVIISMLHEIYNYQKMISIISIFENCLAHRKIKNIEPTNGVPNSVNTLFNLTVLSIANNSFEFQVLNETKSSLEFLDSILYHKSYSSKRLQLISTYLPNKISRDIMRNSEICIYKNDYEKIIVEL